MRNLSRSSLRFHTRLFCVSSCGEIRVRPEETAAQDDAPGKA
jgi:hypothetical protein